MPAFDGGICIAMQIPHRPRLDRIDPAIRGFFIVAVTLNVSCVRPRAPIPNPPANHSSSEWIDLQPGWRVRVITPVLASGGYVVKTTPMQEQGADASASTRPSPGGTTVIAVSANTNLMGYEISLYRVKPRRGGGVRVVFDSAEIHKKEQLTRSRRPIEPLFQFAKSARCVRILHLSRGTHDHNAAILGADSRETLEVLTRQVESDPAECRLGQDALCSWIPPGIAAIPESWKSAAGHGQWEPVF
jgi:hypothetical protein